MKLAKKDAKDTKPAAAVKKAEPKTEKKPAAAKKATATVCSFALSFPFRH